jgi:hypothetical protein
MHASRNGNVVDGPPKPISVVGSVPETTMAGIGGLGVAEQVDRLILEAINVENLCQHYIGWCSFW